MRGYSNSVDADECVDGTNVTDGSDPVQGVDADVVS